MVLQSRHFNDEDRNSKMRMVSKRLLYAQTKVSPVKIHKESSMHLTGKKMIYNYAGDDDDEEGEGEPI